MVTRPLGPPWNEGGKNLSYGIARNIKNKKIHLIVRKNFDERLDNNLILHRVYPSKHQSNISCIEKLRLFFFLLKMKNIDLYHFIYTPETYSSLINKLLMKFKSKKSIQTIPTRLKNISNLKKLIFADKVVVLSDFTKNLFLRHGIKNVVKINTGIDTNYFKPIKKDKSLLKRFDLIGKSIILIPIDLEKEKGTRIMLKIIKSMGNLENLRFIFSYRSTKKRILEERFLRKALSKLGLLNQALFIKDPKNVRSLINISDLIVYPIIDTYEKHETPMILMEAMSMEKPIIISDIAPLNEIIKGNEGIKVKDYVEMKKAIARIIKNRSLAKKIGKLARKRVVNDFNIIETAKEYYELYGQLS